MKLENIKAFYHKDTATMTYVVWCKATKNCAIIDSVMDYDAHAGRIHTAAADEVIAFVTAQGLTTQWILETHIHADHLTAAPYLKTALGGKIGIGECIKEVLDFWVPLYNLPQEAPHFDHLFFDGEVFAIGDLGVQVMHTPGHTPACLSYRIGETVFVGDSMFMPTLGTARVDFPGGSAKALYDSIHKLFQLPDETRIFVGHIYPKDAEDVTWETTIGAQKATNIMLDAGTSLEDYRAKREARDKTLGAPRLLLPSIQVNMRAGELPAPEENGVQYIKIPLNKI